MGAETPMRRKRTAREMAAQLGASERTVRNIIAEPRTEFLSRAAAKRKMAVELREQGHTYSEIATTMGLSIAASASSCTTPANSPPVIRGKPARSGGAAAPHPHSRNFRPASPTNIRLFVLRSAQRSRPV